MEYLEKQKDLVSVCFFLDSSNYIKENLEIILKQENVELEILICTDKENEQVKKSIQELREQYGNVFKDILPAKDWDEACEINLRRATGDYLVFGDLNDIYLDNQKLFTQIESLKKESNCVGVSHKILWTNTDTETYGDKDYCIDNRYTTSYAQKLLKTSPLSAIVFENIFKNKNDWEDLFHNSQLKNDEHKVLLHCCQHGYLWRLNDRMIKRGYCEQNVPLNEQWDKLKKYSLAFSKSWDEGKYFQQKMSLAQKALEESKVEDESLKLFTEIISTLNAPTLTRYQKWEVVNLIYKLSWRMENDKKYVKLLTDCNSFLDEYQVACLLLKGIRRKKKKFVAKLLLLNKDKKAGLLKWIALQVREFSVKRTTKSAKKAKPFISKYILNAPLRKMGFSDYMAREWRNSLIHDVLEKNDIPLRKKIWAWKHGFFSYRLEQYGLTEENYTDFLSDRDYMWLHPINNSYKKWIDDKYTMRAMLEPYKEYLPEYYYHIITRNGKTVYVKLQDCPEQYGTGFQDILSLLKDKKVLALKPAAGTHGEGFFKLSSDGHHFYVNEVEKQISELRKIFENFSCFYIITEYVVMHDQLKEIYAGSVNTIRMMTINKDGNTPKVMNAYMRIGSTKTGFTDNVAYGGVFAQIDLKDGRYFNAEQSKNHVIQKCPYHPDTNTKIEGYLPNWNLVIEKVTEIAGYLTQLEYLGFDIVITPTGFKILEINVHQDLHRYPNYGKEVHEYFMYKLEQKKRRYNRKW